MSMTPVIAIHVTAALGALVTGPVALWARRSGAHRPKLHRAFGYAWVTLMVITALSAIFIRGGRLPNIQGFSPIHLLVPLTLLGLVGSFAKLARGDIRGHRKLMLILYFAACVGAGAFTLLPGRLLGNLVWGEWLGLLSPSFMASHEEHSRVFTTVAQVFSRAPAWVWGLLVALIALGLSQTRRRQVGLVRIAVLPLAMGGFSLWGTVSAFGAFPAVLGLWLAALLSLLVLVGQRAAPEGTAYDAATRRFTLPGSWVPLLLILGIFTVKFAVGASLSVQPLLKMNVPFVLTVTLLNGVFSGLFAGRALRLLRLALKPGTPFATPAIA